MPSPKNWDKEEPSNPNVEMQWSNRKTLDTVEVAGTPSRGYAVHSNQIGRIAEGISNKNDARKRAVQYMEKHTDNSDY